MRTPVAAFVITAGIAAASAAAGVSYWDFNVFSRSTIGSSSQGYTSNFQGAGGSVGSAWFNGFSARSGSGPAGLPGGFYSGGGFTLSGSVASGGLFAAGDVFMNGASVAGGAHIGGNLAGSGGSITGGASIGGAKTVGNALTVSGGLQEGVAYSAPVDLSDASSYFASIGSYAASLASTTGYTNAWGNLLINASGPLTVVDIAASDFTSAWGVTVNGPGAVVVNVRAASLTIASKNWVYQGGASAGQTLLNFADATTLSLSGGHDVNILAALAQTNFSSGVVNGNLIVASLTGGGSANWNGGFQAGASVPAPASAMLIGLAGVCARRRRIDR